MTHCNFEKRSNSDFLWDTEMRSALTIQFHFFDFVVTVFACSLAVLLSLSYFALALPINSTCLRNNQTMALKAAIIGKVDTREFYDDHVKNEMSEEEQKNESLVKEKTAAFYRQNMATGLFYCGAEVSTANLVINNDTIVLSGHAFYEPETCKPLAKNFSKCYFETIPPKGEKPKQYNINAKTLHVGTQCLTDVNPELDYAVVKLQEKVEGVTPYRVPSASYRFNEGMKITALAALHNDRSSADYPRPMVTPNCHAIILRRSSFASLISPPSTSATDCSAQQGSSGGAMVESLGPEKTIIGISIETEKQERNHLPFNKDTNNTTMVLMDGFFLTTVNTVAAQSGLK
jgi:hypothetical protein